MEEEFKAYAENNLLGMYGPRMQKAVEQLFLFGQKHVCDLLIRLTCEKQLQKRDKILEDVEGLNLEELDHVRRLSPRLASSKCCPRKCTGSWPTPASCSTTKATRDSRKKE